MFFFFNQNFHIAECILQYQQSEKTLRRRAPQSADGKRAEPAERRPAAQRRGL